MRAPCLNCSERHATCHATCERYAVWKAESDRQRDERNERNGYADDERSYRQERYRRITGRRD